MGVNMPTNCVNAKFFPASQQRMAPSYFNVGLFDETCFSNDRAGTGFRTRLRFLLGC
ncbi:hypothetical protein CKO_01782 [Citrobacter koseri ATCC BAA-895]|uniref:Uncharacterized protein n=1 Tax=Citrobacter koseri (strain ATCC BAA-895 / CDC 4225-83 / SGSC4696) TaxID=290338 RepID=A8AHE8_CITK8|nr:hypothetical protein CKO_01782 [Citrobacter koseri ATCC BAA-895]